MSSKSDHRRGMDEAMRELEQVADEVRVKLHLAGMGVSDTWKETLEPRLFAARIHAKEATLASKAALEDALKVFRRLAKELDGHAMNAKTIGDLMTKDVATCRASDSVSQCAQLMWDRACGAVVVVDGENHPVSMITDRDICMAGYIQGKPLVEIIVSSAMSQRLLTITATETVAAAEAIMRRHDVRRLPVIDGSGVLVGVFSQADIAKRGNVGATMLGPSSPSTHAVAPA